MNSIKYVGLNTLQILLELLQTKITTNIQTPLVDNTEYRLQDVSSLDIVYPDGNFEVWMNISFSSTETISVNFPEDTKYIGSKPSFSNGEVWEISIKDKVAICWRIE